MKTPKLKAIELVDAMSLTYEVNGDYIYPETSKLCAIIAVNEIIKSNPNDPYPGGYYETYQDRINDCIYYWNQVIKEIKKL